MRVTSSRAYSLAAPVPKMPPGLVELMEGLSKDVLRNNPTNIYEFCANHMQKLIDMRDGPSRKKMLSLEEKIAVAQKKVRQKAKERQKQYDNDIKNADAVTNKPEKDECGQEAQNSSQQELVPNLRAPVHHEQDLSLASEVEISHEPHMDNSFSLNDSIIKTNEIPTSKSSTVSSISKSTVTDLLSNEQDIIKEENIKESNKINDVDIKEAALANIENSDKSRIQDNQSPMSDAIVLNKTPNIHDTVKDNIEKQNNTLEISKSVEHDSVNQIVNLGIADDKLKTAVEEDWDAAQSIEPELINAGDTELLTVSTSERPNIDADTTTEVSIESNKNNEQSVDVQIDEVEESLTNEPVNQSLEDLSLPNSVKNTFTDAKPSLDVSNSHKTNNSDTNEGTVIVKNDHEQSDALKIAEIVLEDTKIETKIADVKNSDKNFVKTDVTISSMLEKHLSSKENDLNFRTTNKEDIVHPPSDEKTINKDSTEGIDKDNTIEIHDIIDGDKTFVKEQINEKGQPSDSEIKDDNKISTINSKTDNVDNDESNIVGSDVSKAKQELPQNGIANEQNNMDLETAAVTIQKVFRSFLFKSRNSTFEDITNDEGTFLEDDNDKKEDYYAADNINQDRRPLGLTRMDTVLQTVNEEKSLSLSTDDSSTLSSAATTIQAHVRGFLVRNRLNSYKTVSTNSLVNSNELLDTDSDQKSKTVLNIHIVPEQANYLSRDESLITSMDLSLDGSPPSSVNLHPLSYDLVSERRKLLKREDAIQSVSPPSNNSGKLSEDSVKEVLVNENDAAKVDSNIKSTEKEHRPYSDDNLDSFLTAVAEITAADDDDTKQRVSNEPDDVEIVTDKCKSPMSQDESDVVTAFMASPQKVDNIENASRLLHSGEFHDVLLPTKVSRSDTTVVREFKNVLAYILLWNAS